MAAHFPWGKETELARRGQEVHKHPGDVQSIHDCQTQTLHFGQKCVLAHDCKTVTEQIPSGAEARK